MYQRKKIYRNVSFTKEELEGWAPLRPDRPFSWNVKAIMGTAPTLRRDKVKEFVRGMRFLVRKFDKMMGIPQGAVLILRNVNLKVLTFSVIQEGLDPYERDISADIIRLALRLGFVDKLNRF